MPLNIIPNSLFGLKSGNVIAYEITSYRIYLCSGISYKYYMFSPLSSLGFR